MNTAVRILCILSKYHHITDQLFYYYIYYIHYKKKHIHTSTQVNTIQIDYKHKNTHKTKYHLHL